MKNGLWVDDSKPVPTEVSGVARTYDEALRLCRRFKYDVLYLDHDLGEQRTGLDLLRQLKAEGCCPPEVVCISWNPVGRRNILAELGQREAQAAGGGIVIVSATGSPLAPNPEEPTSGSPSVSSSGGEK